MANYDVVIIGGGLGGVSAALAAADAGCSVLLAEASDWLGGQLTCQGVCTPDEDGLNNAPVVDSIGSTATYRDLKHRIREFYRGRQLSAAGNAENPLNPGGCWVNFGFGTEALVALNVLKEMAAERPAITIQYNAKVTIGSFADRQVQSLTLTLADGSTEVVQGKVYLDATETGELLPLLGLRFNIGAESIADTGEPDAENDPHPEYIQGINVPFAVLRRPKGEDHTIPKPDGYEDIRSQQKFSLKDGDMVAMDSGKLPFWTYRRVINSRLFAEPAYTYDIATINVKANDFSAAAYPSGDAITDEQTYQQARAVSIAYMYWLQTEAPREGGGNGFPEFMFSPNFFGPNSSVALQPYVRESRRIIALKRVVEQDIVAPDPPDHWVNPGIRAHLFSDSCGIGNYAMDVHACANGGKEIQKHTYPYQIPAGALIPQDCDNLLASCKNIGLTHITNGAYRLHPQEWNIGEAAGTLAAQAANANVTTTAIYNDENLLSALQRSLLARGVPLYWWTDIAFGDADYAAIHMVGAKQYITGEAGTFNFSPNDPVDAATQTALSAKVGIELNWPSTPCTRREAARTISAAIP